MRKPDTITSKPKTPNPKTPKPQTQNPKTPNPKPQNPKTTDPKPQNYCVIRALNNLQCARQFINLTPRLVNPNPQDL